MMRNRWGTVMRHMTVEKACFGLQEGGGFPQPCKQLAYTRTVNLERLAASCLLARSTSNSGAQLLVVTVHMYITVMLCVSA